VRSNATQWAQACGISEDRWILVASIVLQELAHHQQSPHNNGPMFTLDLLERLKHWGNLEGNEVIINELHRVNEALAKSGLIRKADTVGSRVELASATQVDRLAPFAGEPSRKELKKRLGGL
jgi:hypothetical protein